MFLSNVSYHLINLSGCNAAEERSQRCYDLLYVFSLPRCVGVDNRLSAVPYNIVPVSLVGIPHGPELTSHLVRSHSMWSLFV